MTALRIRAALGALALVWALCAMAGQQDPASPSSAPAAAATTGVAESSTAPTRHSFFHRLESHLRTSWHRHSAGASGSAPQGVAATDTAPASSANGAGGFFHRLTAPWHHGSAGSSEHSADGGSLATDLSRHGDVRVVDISTVSNRADQVVDPSCKVLVQPFGAVGSSMSLAAFAAKVELMNKLGMGSGSDIHEIVRRAALQLNWLPAPTEAEIGQHLLAKDRPDILPRDHGRIARTAYSHAEQTLAAVLAQVHAPLPYGFRIYVLKEAQGNASSLPGGIVLVDEDVVGRRWDPDVAFFKVAHEVSHVLQRHETHAYQAALVDGVRSLADLRKLIANSSQRSAGSVIGQLWGFKSLVINFSSQQELQADACAVRIMRSRYTQEPQLVHALRDVLASFPPAIANSQQSMQPKDLDGVLKFLTNGVYERHPDTRQRRENIVRMLAQKPGQA